jgi:bifunctional DNA-binding transcriptional regulator/antitoxin component of YhaV-PrlF toxin-antitoxin module
MQIARVPLRKINEALRITLPLKLTRELGLKAGDYVDLVQEDGGMKLRFLRVKTPAELEAVEVAPPAELAEAS